MGADETLEPRRFGESFRRFMDAVLAEAGGARELLVERLHAHLGRDLASLAVVAESFDVYDHPNLQVALDAYLTGAGRSADLVGITAQNKRFMSFALSDLMSADGTGVRVGVGPVDYINFHLEDDRVLPCIQFGLLLITAERQPIVAFVAGQEQMGPRGERVRFEVAAAERPIAEAFLRDIRALMRERNVYRGKAISLSPGQYGVQALVKFHRLPRVPREDVILPDGLLERIERHAIVVSEHAERLRAAGRSLKRGLLLYGPPGTGKTYTVMYLAGRMRERTCVITTGRGLGLIQSIGFFARALQPATIVLEDVDLVAQERGMPGVQVGPILFELLNEMDGLAEDADVLFVLTTNRPDILEPALAARPGRVDLAVELPLPDAEGRRRLVALYARGLNMEGVDVGRLVDRTDGASPAYIKELLRKAALLAAIDADGDRVTVRDQHLLRALDELAEGGRLADRLLGLRPQEETPPPPAGPMRPIGFPGTARDRGVLR